MTANLSRQINIRVTERFLERIEAVARRRRMATGDQVTAVSIVREAVEALLEREEAKR